MPILAYIGSRMESIKFGLTKGTVVTIEPGYYEQNKFGIRIENCYELIEAKNLSSGAINFLAFAPLTLVPIQKNLIIRDQLEPKHVVSCLLLDICILNIINHFPVLAQPLP